MGAILVYVQHLRRYTMPIDYQQQKGTNQQFDMEQMWTKSPFCYQRQQSAWYVGHGLVSTST